MKLNLLSTSLTDLLNQSHLVYKSSVHKCVLSEYLPHFKCCSTGKKIKCFNSSMNHMCISISSLNPSMKTEYDEILYMKTHQDGHNKRDFTSTDHDDSNTSLPCLLYVLNEFVTCSKLSKRTVYYC